LGISLLHRRYRRRRPLHTVTDLRAEENYILWIQFDDGLEGRVCLTDLLSSYALDAIADACCFRRVRVDPVANVVTWEEGGINLDPDLLYRDVASKVQMALH